MKNGTQKVITAALLGYDTDEDGNMVIISQEAEIVRTIYKSFIQGVHPSLIAIRLNGLGLKTVFGNDWSNGSVKNILRNEKYCGDVLMQKTITIDYLSHASKVNEGEAEQYYIADHHDPIVTREIWAKAQELLDKQSWHNWKRREQIRLFPVQSGRLTGFVPISPDWKSISLTRLETASSKYPVLEQGQADQNEIEDDNEIKESEDDEMAEVSVLEGFEEVELEQSKGDSVLTLTSSNLKFNKATAVELDYPAYVKMYINAATKQVAIKPCKENAKNAVAFSKDKSKQTYAIVVKVPALLTAMKKLVDMEGTGTAVAFSGELFPNERVIIYDVTQGQPAKTRRRRKKKDLSTEGADNKEDSKSEQGNE